MDAAGMVGADWTPWRSFWQGVYALLITDEELAIFQRHIAGDRPLRERDGLERRLDPEHGVPGARARAPESRELRRGAGRRQAGGSGLHPRGRRSAINGRRENKVWQQSNVDDNASNVAPYYHDLNDLRVPVVDKGTTNTLGRPIFYETKYPTSATPMPIATYEEAQLIIAEAELEMGDPQVAVGILSDLREAAVQGPFASTDPATIRAELIEQRRRELFLEGHHLGDFIRFELPFDRPAGTDYFGSGQYGEERCLQGPARRAAEQSENPVAPGVGPWRKRLRLSAGRSLVAQRAVQ